eukprot:m.22766 g.22766  ORF g.22766 m.22766 type:complete len:255 (+) comp11293_c0_seq1:54-818(+)
MHRVFSTEQCTEVLSSKMADDDYIIALQERLSYDFQDIDLLKQALIHPSIASEVQPSPPDNERLEFLGDAVIGLAVAKHVYNHYQDADEGIMTKLRAAVVSKDPLAKAARRLELGFGLQLSNGEEGNNGRTRASNLANAFEAVIGAIYLDGGADTATACTLACLDQELKGLDLHQIAADQANPKSALQETLQKISVEVPSYQVVKEEGPPNARTFTVAVFWRGQELGQGVGPKKKMAEAQAARQALLGKAWVDV